MKIFAFRFRFDILNSLLQSYEKMENSSKHFTYYIYANVYVVQESGASETPFSASISKQSLCTILKFSREFFVIGQLSQQIL
jgi:hypothetical protein